MKKQGDGNRRSFLKHMLAGTAAVVGTAAVIKPAKARPVNVSAGTDETLYRETEAFKKYYKSIRS